MDGDTQSLIFGYLIFAALLLFVINRLRGGCCGSYSGKEERQVCKDRACSDDHKKK
ncbi:MAG: hypothetical protein JSW20_11640 [Nitrospiraceae bacterium]|nr:MAG: hypothetical protein JSW20_11640 [Nitrospiraceae bacterium]